jgi:predicted ATPase
MNFCCACSGTPVAHLAGWVVGLQGVNTLRAGLDRLLETRFVVRYLSFIAELAEALARIGEIENARVSVNNGLDRCERNEEFWYLPELLRIKGEILLRDGTPQAAQTAETAFLQSLERARKQNVLSWELRAATSLARLWRSIGRLDDGRELLASVYGRFTEGFATPDLRAAKHILDDAAEHA